MLITLTYLATLVAALKGDTQWQPLNSDGSFLFGDDYDLVILNRPIEMTADQMAPLWNNATRRLAVDKGLNRWLTFKATHPEAHFHQDKPDLLSGDFDSIVLTDLAQIGGQGVRVIPTLEQNHTDFSKALQFLVNNLQAENIVVVCEHSGRLDHTLANLNSLYEVADLFDNGRSLVRVYIVTRDSVTWVLPPGNHSVHVPRTLREAHRAWVGLLPLGQPAMVATTGLMWNLGGVQLEFGSVISSSNTYDGSPTVTVTTDSNLVWTMGLGHKED